MGHCAILGLAELCYLSERTYPVIRLEYNPTIADYLNTGGYWLSQQLELYGQGDRYATARQRLGR